MIYFVWHLDIYFRAALESEVCISKPLEGLNRVAKSLTAITHHCLSQCCYDPVGKLKQTDCNSVCTHLNYRNCVNIDNKSIYKFNPDILYISDFGLEISNEEHLFEI